METFKHHEKETLANFSSLIRFSDTHFQTSIGSRENLSLMQHIKFFTVCKRFYHFEASFINFSNQFVLVTGTFKRKSTLFICRNKRFHKFCLKRLMIMVNENFQVSRKETLIISITFCSLFQPNSFFSLQKPSIGFSQKLLQIYIKLILAFFEHHPISN